MDRNAKKRLPAAVSGLLVLLVLHLGPLGCQNTVWVTPEEGSVQEGPFGVQVYWAPEMVASTLRVSMNQEEITGHLSPADISEGVLGMFFAFFHGFAHGQEMPLAASPWGYAAGMLAATALLHAAGVLAGVKVRAAVLRLAGAAVSLAGIGLLMLA